MSEDFIVCGIPYESHQEKSGKVITLKASQYHTQKMIDNAIEKVRSDYANRDLSRIKMRAQGDRVVEQEKGGSTPYPVKIVLI